MTNGSIYLFTVLNILLSREINNNMSGFSGEKGCQNKTDQITDHSENLLKDLQATVSELANINT